MLALFAGLPLSAERAPSARSTRWLAPAWLGLFVLLSALSACQPTPAFAQEIRERVPAEAQQHRRTLMRAARTHWGMDAPIATFAAQVHQESRWRVNARSPVGAEGLAQFMPGTSDWFARLYPQYLGERQPFNPGWALNALVLYDAWLYERNNAVDECNRWAMALSGYNGGHGWVIRDRALASAKGADPLVWFDHIERHSDRSPAAFDENRDYVRRILLRWEPLYVSAGWGAGVCQ